MAAREQAHAKHINRQTDRQTNIDYSRQVVSAHLCASGYEQRAIILHAWEMIHTVALSVTPS